MPVIDCNSIHRWHAALAAMHLTFISVREQTVWARWLGHVMETLTEIMTVMDGEALTDHISSLSSIDPLEESTESPCSHRSPRVVSYMKVIRIWGVLKIGVYPNDPL